MKKALLILCLIMFVLAAFSEEGEDTTVIAIPYPSQGIIKISSPEKIDSVEIWGILGKLKYKTNVINGIADINSVTRSCYYVVFITESKKRLRQKLFFLE